MTLLRNSGYQLRYSKLYFVLCRTSSVGKVDDFESGGPRFESGNNLPKKSACTVGQGVLPKIVLEMTIFCPSIITMVC